ncbi:MAG TPA: hypothetical protein HPP59_01585 [Deltaproteobacteria bacterium]|nr:hypothetical protein [Deltaproteobacteria bacterium]HIJ40785.1 hypothetical protein [Deltaproteobacteria bacterium]
MELPKRPLLAGEEGIRLSLAGAQNKLPVYMEDDQIFIATGNSPSTHILKLPIAGFEETVLNEAFCMSLASGQRCIETPVCARFCPGYDVQDRHRGANACGKS